MNDKALALLLYLVEHGSWYYSAIELDFQVSGEDLKEQAIRILEDAGIEIKEN